MRLRPNRYQYIYCNTLYHPAVILGFLKWIRVVRVTTYCLSHAGGPESEVQIATRKLGEGYILRLLYFFILRNDRINVLSDGVWHDLVAIG